MEDDLKDQGAAGSATPADGHASPPESVDGEGKGKKFSFTGVPPAWKRPKITCDEMYQLARTFGRKAFMNDQIVSKLRGTGMIMRMEYFDPENWGEEEPQITIDITKDPVELHTGPCDTAPVLTLRMHAHIAHMFWMRKLNLMTAFLRGQMTARGPMSMTLRLLPMIKPSFPLYRESLAELGFDQLLNYPDKDTPDAETV